MRPCEGCPLTESCIHPYIFDTPRPQHAEKMRRYDRVPHPFVLQPSSPQRASAPGAGATDLSITLIGRANRYAAYVVLALAAAGARGVGPGRPVMTLRAVGMPDASGEPGDWFAYPGEPLPAAMPTAPEPPACPGLVEIRLLTPLRLKDPDGLVAPERFRPAHLLRSLVRRVSLLSYFHTDTPLETDFRGLIAAAERVRMVDSHLTWLDWTRRSARQGTTMQMGGLLGRLTLDLSAAEELWPYLWLGRWVHAGKGATMGLGALRIGAAA